MVKLAVDERSAFFDAVDEVALRKIFEGAGNGDTAYAIDFCQLDLFGKFLADFEFPALYL